MERRLAGAGREPRYDPFDLAPAAIMDEIAQRAAAAREPRSLARRMVAEPADKRVRIGEGRAVRKVDMFLQVPPHDVLAATVGAWALRNLPAKLLNGAFTRKDGKARPALPWGAMARAPRRDARAGGSLLALSVVAGAIGGVIGGRPSVGLVAGLAVGLALLGLVWLIDRRG